MFYVEVKRPIYLKGKRQIDCAEIHKKFGVNPGIHLVDDGVVHGEAGDVFYLDYPELFDILPTYRGNWDEDTAIESSEGKDLTAMSLYLGNGLLLQQDITVELHEINCFPNDGEGAYLLLCSRNGYYFQVITP